MRKQQLTKHLNDYSYEDASLHKYYNDYIVLFKH